jgi:hypothetical protein
MTAVENIKRLEEECAKLCEESAHIWTNLMDDLEMKVLEDKLINAQEKKQKALENISMLPPTECMTTILAQRKSYNEIEKIRDQHKILQQCLVSLQDEEIRVIGELAASHGKIKQTMHDSEEKLMTLTT